MSRPYCSHSIEQLEELFGDGNEAQDRNLLSQLASELENRKTLRAGRLRQAVAEALKGDSSVSPQGSSTPTRPASRKEASKPASRVPMKHKPTPEQDEAIARFETGGSLKINAFAGTGKTSTLQMLAGSTPKRGQYIAFNKAIVADARDKFPQTVNCSTTHGLAFKAMSPKYGRNIKKLTERVNANQLAELLNLKKWRVDQGHTLAPRSQSYLILETVRRFAHSAHPEPTDTHVPRHGSLLAAPDSTLEAVKAFAVRGAKHVWERMQDPDDSIPLGHDGYLKMWGLSDPIIAADFILLDEAQDTNPVVLNVLRNQPAQMIYVGDKYQQIYEWRGAINAMEEIGTDYSTFLTTSFRFGPEIAGGASKVLSILGEARPINGNTAVQSRIGPVTPQTILARTNATTITAIIDALDSGKRPHLVGGTGELMEMLRGVQDLKQGQPSTVPDFFGFNNWKEIVEFAKSGEGEHLLTFVNLVESRSERQLMWALSRTVDDDKCDLTISTAHKAKGREWQTVRLMDDFLKSQPREQQQSRIQGRIGHDASELRLFYVALTRAREAIEVPSNILDMIGVKNVGASPSNSASATHSNSARTAPLAPARGERPRTSFVAPTNWQPRTPPVAPRPVDASPVTPRPSISAKLSLPPRKGFWNWLTGG